MSPFQKIIVLKGKRPSLLLIGLRGKDWGLSRWIEMASTQGKWTRRARQVKIFSVKLFKNIEQRLVVIIVVESKWTRDKVIFSSANSCIRSAKPWAARRKGITTIQSKIKVLFLGSILKEGASIASEIFQLFLLRSFHIRLSTFSK